MTRLQKRLQCWPPSPPAPLPGTAKRSAGEGNQAVSAKRGFTLIDLLIFIVISATLFALLSVWVQWSRESARQAVCRSNLKLLGSAFINAESTSRHLPTNGWGYCWIGDPARGQSVRQPAGCLYNAIPYMVSNRLHDLQLGLSYGTTAQTDAVKRMCTTPWFYFYCPGRRPREAYPFTHKPMANNGTTSFNNTGLFCDAGGYNMLAVAKSDYAGNGGQTFFTADTLPGEKMCDAGGPIGSLTPGSGNLYEAFDTAIDKEVPIQDGTGRWTLSPEQGIEKFEAAADGIFFPFSTVQISEIVDGTKATYLCGEKFLPTDHYTDGRDDGDDQCAYMGHDKDITRWAQNEQTKKLAGPLRDCPAAKAGPGANSLFGSPHPNGCNMCFCDCTVRVIDFAIDPQVHARSANRMDSLGPRPADAAQPNPTPNE